MTPAERPLPLLTKPWFWLLFIGSLFSIPLIKGLGADLPEPLPGWDREPLTLELPNENGTLVSLEDLRGQLVLLTALPLANGVQTERVFDGIRRLRKRLRGLGGEVVYLVLCHGGGPAELTALIDAKKARKPVNLFLLDDDRLALDALWERVGSPTASFALLDRHGRVRGVYGESPADLDALVTDTGQLANWIGSDPEPGAAVGP